PDDDEAVADDDEAPDDDEAVAVIRGSAKTGNVIDDEADDDNDSFIAFISRFSVAAACKTTVSLKPESESPENSFHF
ncbi:MAG: hypothetical protein EBS26_04210, partial [Bacteroidia bacterium]|nr:hypothetical protein [Bacteroidia bacterium]